jgi:hypothetical protein
MISCCFPQPMRRERQAPVVGSPRFLCREAYGLPLDNLHVHSVPADLRMRQVPRSSLIFVTGLCVSLAGHAALGVGFARWADELLAHDPAGSRFPLSPSPQTKDPVRERASPDDRNYPDRREIRLGIEDGSAATLTWLGFREATEHQAKQGPTEQSAMSLDDDMPGWPGSRSAASEPSHRVPADIPIDFEATAGDRVPRERFDMNPPAEEVTAPDTPQEEPTEALESQDLRRELAERIAATTAEAAERLAESVEQLLAPRPSRIESRPAAERVETGKRAPEHPFAGVNPSETAVGTGGTAGIVSDKEAIATSIREAPVVRPGRVLAAKGLEISTRRPRFGVATRMTRAPKNPVVEITFGPDGRVKRATFVTDGSAVYNTGSDEVDQPLLNAVYSWTAKGKSISELDPNDSEAGVTIMITIILLG